MSPRSTPLTLYVSVVLTALVILVLGLYYFPTVPYITFLLGVCGIVCYYHHTGETSYARLGPNPLRGLTLPPVLLRWFTGRTASGVRNRTGQRRLETTIYRRRDSIASEPSSVTDWGLLMGSFIGNEAGRRLGSNVNPNPRDIRERVCGSRELLFTGEVPNIGRFTPTPQRHYPLQRAGTSLVGILPPTQWDSFRKKNILSPRHSTAVSSPVTVKIARPDHHSIRSPFFDHLSSPGGLGSPGLGAPAPDPCSKETVLRVLKERNKRGGGEDDDDEDRSLEVERESKRRRADSGSSSHSGFEPLLPNGAPTPQLPKPGTLKRGTNSNAEQATAKRSRRQLSEAWSAEASHSAAPSSIPALTRNPINRARPGLAQSKGKIASSARNSINSSYSSSHGLAQCKRASKHSLCSVSSAESSRSQTPERPSKKAREEDTQSPSSASSVRSEMSPDAPTNTCKVTLAPEVPVAAMSSPVGSSGKQKRKIQLVSSRRGDQISLPPPPELGYTITVKDLDQEKKAVLSKIQKELEEPEPEEPGPPPAVVPTTSQPTSFIDSTTTLSSLLAAPLPTASTPAKAAAPIPVINLDPPSSTIGTVPTTTAAPAQAPTSAPASNPLLEFLKMNSNTLANITSTATTTAALMTPAEPSGSTLKPASTSDGPQLAPVSQPTTTTLGQTSSSIPSAFTQVLGQTSSSVPSAFTQVLGQVTKPPSTISTMPAAGLFGLANPLATLTASSAPAPIPASTTTTSEPASSANPPLASMFKPIFGATTASPATTGSENKPSVPTFKTLFATSNGGFGQPATITATTSVPAASSTTASASSIFGALASSTTAAPSTQFTGLVSSTVATPASTSSTTDTAAQQTVKSLFGSWAAASTAGTTSTSTAVPATGSTFQFGAAATTTAMAPAAPTAPTNSTFAFGAMATTQPPAPQPNTQMNPFGQTAPTPGSTAASFGSFGNAATITVDAASATKSTFPFGKPSFEASAPPAYPSATVTTGKPFTFGTGGGATAPVSAPTPSPFGFGAAATTTASTFGTQAKPMFGAGSSGFAFGNTTAPSAAPGFGAVTQAQTAPAPSATPGFGAVTQAQTAPAPSATPGFGAVTQAQAAPASTFSFGGAAAQQTLTTPAQQGSGGFNFGAAASGNQFGSVASNNPAPPAAGFNFGAAAQDKTAFAVSTPVFGQSAPAPAMSFGSHVLPSPVQGFGAAVPFGSPASFSIGAGSKPSGARQRLQARRQHPRKK